MNTINSLNIKKIITTVILSGLSSLSFAQTFLEVNVSKSDVDCYGNNNGSIALTISGGQEPYEISWSNGSTDQNQSGLTPGIYSVQVKDNNDVVSNKTVQIEGPETPILITSVVTNVTQFGLANGTIDVTISGGSPFKWTNTPYEILWSNNVTTEDQSNLSAGTYKIYVTDRNGCVSSKKITVQTPFQIPFGNGTNGISVAPETVTGTIYPNPSRGNISIINENASVEFIRIVSAVSGEQTVLENTGKTLQLQGLTPGDYYIYFEGTDNTIQTEKVTIL